MEAAQHTKYQQVQELIGRMQKNLECAICLDMLKNPVSTKCDHHFCRYCIVECLQKKSSVPCPLCKKPVTKRSLNDQTKLANIVDGVRALIAAFQQDTGVIYTPKKGPTAVSLMPFSPEPTCSQRISKRHIDLQDETRMGRERKRSKRQKLDNGGDDCDLSSHVTDPTIRLLETDPADIAHSSCDTVHYTYSAGISKRQAASVVEKMSVQQRDEPYVKPNLSEFSQEVKNASPDRNNDSSSVDLLSAMRSGLLQYLNEGSCGAGCSSTFDENSYSSEKTADLTAGDRALIRQIENAEFKPNTESLSSSEKEDSNMDVRTLEIDAENNEMNVNNIVDSVDLKRKCVDKEIIEAELSERCIDKNYSAIEESELNQSCPTAESSGDNCTETCHVLPNSAISTGNISMMSETVVKIGVFGSQSIEQTHLKDGMSYQRVKRNRKNIEKVKNWMSTLPKGTNFDSVVDCGVVNILNNTNTADGMNKISKRKTCVLGASQESIHSEICHEDDGDRVQQDMVTSNNQKVECRRVQSKHATLNPHSMPKIIDLTDDVDERFAENRHAVLKTMQTPMRRIFKSRLLNVIHKSPNKPKCKNLQVESPKRDPYEFNPSQKTPKAQRNKVRKARVTNKTRKSRITEKKKLLQLQITQGILERKSRKYNQNSDKIQLDSVPLETKQTDDVINLDKETENEYQDNVVGHLESVGHCEEPPVINDDIGKNSDNDCEDEKDSVILSQSQTHDNATPPSVICGRKILRKIKNCDRNCKIGVNWNDIVKKDGSSDRRRDFVDISIANTGVDIKNTDIRQVLVKTCNMNYELGSSNSDDANVRAVRRSRHAKTSRKKQADANFQKHSDTVVVKMTSELNQAEDYELMFCSQDVHAKLSRVPCDENIVPDHHEHGNNERSKDHGNMPVRKSNNVPNHSAKQLTDQHKYYPGQDENVNKISQTQISDISSVPTMDILGPSPHIFKGIAFKLPRCLPPTVRFAGRVRTSHPHVEVENNADVLTHSQSPIHHKLFKESVSTKTISHQDANIKHSGFKNNISNNDSIHVKLCVSECDNDGGVEDIIDISLPASSASTVEAKSSLRIDSFQSQPIAATEDCQPSLNYSEPVMTDMVLENVALAESERASNEVIVADDGPCLLSDADDNMSSSTEDLNIHPDDSEYEPVKHDSFLHSDADKDKPEEQDSNIHLDNGVDRPEKPDHCFDPDDGVDEAEEQDSCIHLDDSEDEAAEFDSCIYPNASIDQSAEDDPCIRSEDGMDEPAEPDSCIHSDISDDSMDEPAEPDSCIHSDISDDSMDESAEPDSCIHCDGCVDEPAEAGPCIHPDDSVDEPGEQDSCIQPDATKDEQVEPDSFVHDLHTIVESAVILSVDKDEQIDPPSPHQESNTEDKHIPYSSPGRVSPTQHELVANSNILDHTTKNYENDSHLADVLISGEHGIETVSDESEPVQELSVPLELETGIYNKKASFKKNKMSLKKRRSAPATVSLSDKPGIDEAGIKTDVESERKSCSIETIHESYREDSTSIINTSLDHDNLQPSCTGSIKTIQDSCVTDCEQLLTVNTDVDKEQACSSVRIVSDSLKPATQQSFGGNHVPVTGTLADEAVITPSFQCMQQGIAQELSNCRVDADNYSPTNNTTHVHIAGNVISGPEIPDPNMHLNIEGSVEDIFGVNNGEQLPDVEEEDFSENGGLEIMMLGDEDHGAETDNYRVLDTEDVNNNNSVVNSQESTVGEVNDVIHDSCVDVEDDIIDDNDYKSECNNSQYADVIDKNTEVNDDIEKDIEASKTSLVKSAEISTTSIPESLENFSSDRPKFSLHKTQEDEYTESLKTRTLNFLSKNLGDEFSEMHSDSAKSQDSCSNVERSRSPKPLSRTARGIMARRRMNLRSTDALKRSENLLSSKDHRFRNNQESVTGLEDVYEIHDEAENGIPVEQEIKMSTESRSTSSSGRSSKSQSLLQDDRFQKQLTQGANGCPNVKLINLDSDNICKAEGQSIKTVASLENIPESVTSLPMRQSQPSVNSSIQPLMSSDPAMIQLRTTQLSDQYKQVISASYPVLDATLLQRSTQSQQDNSHSKEKEIVSGDIREHKSMAFGKAGNKISSQDGLQSEPHCIFTPITTACQSKQCSIDNEPVNSNDNLSVVHSGINIDEIRETSYKSDIMENIATLIVSQTNIHGDTEMSECNTSAYNAMADSCEFDQVDGKAINSPDCNHQVRKSVTLQVCDLDEETIHDLDRQAQEALQGLDHTTQFGTSFSSCNQSYFQDVLSGEPLSEHVENSSQNSNHDQTICNFINDDYHDQPTDLSQSSSQEVPHTVTSDSLHQIADLVPPENSEQIPQSMQHENVPPIAGPNHIEIATRVTSQNQKSRTRSSSQWSNISFPESSQTQFPTCDLECISTTFDVHENSQTVKHPVSSQVSDKIFQSQRDGLKCEISDPRPELLDIPLPTIVTTEKQSFVSNYNNNDDIAISTSQTQLPSEAMRSMPEKHQDLESSKSASISCSVSKKLEDDNVNDKEDDIEDEDQIDMCEDDFIMAEEQHPPAEISDSDTAADDDDDDDDDGDVGNDKGENIDDVVPLDLYSDSDEDWECDVTLKPGSGHDCAKQETGQKGVSDKDLEIETMKAKIALLEKQLSIQNYKKSLLENGNHPALAGICDTSYYPNQDVQLVRNISKFNNLQDDNTSQVSGKKTSRGWEKKVKVPPEQTDASHNSENTQGSGSKTVIDKHLKGSISLRNTYGDKQEDTPLVKKHAAEKSNVRIHPATPCINNNTTPRKDVVKLPTPCDVESDRVDQMTGPHIVVEDNREDDDKDDDEDNDDDVLMEVEKEPQSQESEEEFRICKPGRSMKFESPSRIDDSQPQRDEDFVGNISKHDDVVVSSSDESDDLFLSPMSPSPPPPVLRSFKKLGKKSSDQLPEEFRQAEAILEELKLTGKGTGRGNKAELGKTRKKLSDQICTFKKNDTIAKKVNISFKIENTSPVKILDSQRNKGKVKKTDIAECLNEDEDEHLVLFSPDDDDTLAVNMSLIAHGLKTEQLPVPAKMEKSYEKDYGDKSHMSQYGPDRFLSPRPPEKSSLTFQSPTVSSSQSQVPVSRSAILPVVPALIISPAIGRLQMFSEQQGVSPSMTPSPAVLTPRPFSDNMQQGFRSPSRIQRKRCFVSSGLEFEQAQQLRQFANMVEAKFFGKFSPSVTHVIVKPVSLKSQLCDRTLKYFQGISNGCWIVSSKWITDCLMAKTVLPEEEYEVHGDTVNGPRQYGPRRSRTADRPMLKGFECFCSGKCDNLSKDDLRDMLEYCGATVVLDPSFFSFDPHRKCMIIDQSEEPTPKEKAILRKYQKRFGVITVSQEWLLDSIAQYRAQPYDDYLVLEEAETAE